MVSSSPLALPFFLPSLAQSCFSCKKEEFIGSNYEAEFQVYKPLFRLEKNILGEQLEVEAHSWQYPEDQSQLLECHAGPTLQVQFHAASFQKRKKNREAVPKLFFIRLLFFKLLRQDREYQHHQGHEKTTEVSGSGSEWSTISS